MKDFFELKRNLSEAKKEDTKLPAAWKSEPPVDKSLDRVIRSATIYEPAEFIEMMSDGSMDDGYSQRDYVRGNSGNILKRVSKHYKKELLIQIGIYSPPGFVFDFKNDCLLIGIFVDGSKVGKTDDANTPVNLVIKTEKELSNAQLKKLAPYIERKLFEGDRLITKDFNIKIDAKGNLR